MNAQPLDTFMTQLGISNADLVRASTEQLSFKMVQKGRAGREISPNIQEKILRAFLSVKPDMKLRTRELFHYPMSEAAVEGIQAALSSIGNKKIKYPNFIDHLLEAGVTHYAVNVAAGRVTFYAAYGQAHIEQSPAVSEGPLGRYGEAALRAVIADAQKELIDHPTFLKRIHDAGIVRYEVNLRKRRIVYKGETLFYKEMIPVSIPETVKPAAAPKAPGASLAVKKKKKAKKSTGVRNSLKGRKASRNRRY